MRDGIYKNLPLGRGWQSFLKSCEREKERAHTASVKALRAIVAEVGAELSGKFLHELLATAKRSESLLPGFRGIDRYLSCRDLGGSNSPFENDVLASAKRIEAQGTRGRGIVYGALNNSIQNLKRRRLRQIEQHCLSTAGAESKAVINAARQAVLRADTSSLADQLIRGEKPKAPRLSREIELDEDLTKVR